MTTIPIREQLHQLADELGFDQLGVLALPADLQRAYYLKWIDQGQHGDMRWMERNQDRRLQPENLLPGARSILCLGLNYYQPDPDRRGRIAKYALGADYHKRVLNKLKVICRFLRDHYQSDQRPYVDTGPVMEKPLAALAGLGWQGKSTILLNRSQGTWLFLGVIVTTLELPPDEPAKDHCGSCTRCISACPTGAITAPYQLDARRCIAYLTIEHHGPIPVQWRKAIGDRLFGCDECLDVCPWNRWAQKSREASFQARPYPDLQQFLAFDQNAFDQMFAGSPIRRLGLSRWQRNVCVVLGNIGTAGDLPALERAAAGGDALVSEHASWAIAEIQQGTSVHRT